MRRNSLQRIVANGVRIAYQQMGSGPPVILIHGLATNRAFWYTPIARRLAQRFQVTIYDLRGHGFSDMPECGYRPEEMAGDLQALMDGLDIERAHIVGHSFGGSVALSFTAAHPERVMTLCAADTLINILQGKKVDKSRTIEISPVESAIMERAQIDPSEEKHLGIRLLEEFDWSDVGEASQQIDTVSGKPAFVPFAGLGGGKRVLGRWKKLIATTSASEDFRQDFHLGPAEITRVDRPTLLVYGGISRSLPSGERLGELLPVSRLAVVPGAGHFHPVMRPRIFMNHLLRFIRMQQLNELVRSKRARSASSTVKL